MAVEHNDTEQRKRATTEQPLLILIDGQEIARANETSGGRLRPAAIRNAIRRHGEIALSFIVGRPEGIPLRLEEDLIIAGFPIVPFAAIDDEFLRRFAHPLARLAGLQPVEVTLDGAHEIAVRAIDCGRCDVAANDRRLLVVLDTENLARTLAGVGDELRPSVLRETIEKHGEIAFAVAVGNADVDSIPERLWTELAQQGFLPIHCPSLATVTAGGAVLPQTKNTVDGTMVDLAHRFLQHTEIDGVILVSDDRDFAPVINAIRDRGLWFRRVSARHGGQLATIGEIIPFPIAGEPAEVDGCSWAPHRILEHLRELASLDRDGRGKTIRRMELLQPVVMQALRVLILTVHGVGPLAIGPLATRWHRAIRMAGVRANVEMGELEAFAENLVDAGVLEEVDGRLVQLREDHSLCARIRSETPAPTAGANGRRTALLSVATASLPSVCLPPRRTYFVQHGGITYYLQATDEQDAIDRTATALARQERLSGEAIAALRASLRATTTPTGGAYVQLP